MSDPTTQETNKRNALPPPDVDLRTDALVDWLRWIDPKEAADADYSVTKKSQQWIKLVREGAAFAFVARRPMLHRTLGPIEAGDVMFPAGWSKPARTARGNVLSPDGGRSAIDPGYGGIRPHIRYLANSPNRPYRRGYDSTPQGRFGPNPTRS